MFRNKDNNKPTTEVCVVSAYDESMNRGRSLSFTRKVSERRKLRMPPQGTNDDPHISFNSSRSADVFDNIKPISFWCWLQQIQMESHGKKMTPRQTLQLVFAKTGGGVKRMVQYYVNDYPFPTEQLIEELWDDLIDRYGVTMPKKQPTRKKRC